jgi:hypothetical protein
MYSCCIAYWLMFLRIGAGSGAPWLPWYGGGRHGSMCFIDPRVCCARFVRKIHLPATIRLFVAREQKIPPLAHTYWESLDFCPSPESLKRTKKIFSDYGLDTTKTVICLVSDGVGVVQYGRQTGQGFKPRSRAV